jgi:hypothetical protein
VNLLSAKLGLLAAILAVLLLSQHADACSRCGFRSPCAFVHHQQAVVAPVAVVKQPDVFVVQNNYPQPLAGQQAFTAPLAQQGSTVYSYSQAAAPYFVDPAAILAQAANLATAANQTALAGLNGYGDTARLQLQLQATLAAPMAQGAAAAQVLDAVGINPQRAQLRQQTSSLRIYQDASGAWQVEQPPQQVAQQITARAQITQPPSAKATPHPEQIPVPAAGGSLIAAKCGRCHGQQLAEPKGKLYLDGGLKLDCKAVLASIKAIKTDTMPKGEKLTPEEKGRLLDELLTLSAE